MLPLWVHFSEGFRMAVGNEDRIIAETAIAARRPNDGAEHLSFEHLHRAVRRRKRKRAGEIGAAIARPCPPQLLLHAPHGKAEIFGIAAPTGRMDPRLPAKRGDLESRIVGKSGKSSCHAGSERLDRRVFGKAAAGLLRLWQGQL